MISKTTPKNLLADSVTSGEYFFLDLGEEKSGPLEIKLGGREVCDALYRVERDSYPFVTLEYVAEGQGTISFGNTPPQTLSPGTVLAYDKRTPHVLVAGQGRPLVKYFLCLSGKRARTELAAAGPLFGATLQLPAHEAIRDLFDTLIREGQERHEQAPGICRHLARAILLKIGSAKGRGETRSSRSRERFLKAKLSIDSRFMSIQSIDTLAASLGIDLSHLNRLFKRFQGTSPYQYLLHKRMTVAARAFLSTDGLVKEVAARCGYEDPYHFSRVFKSIHGLSPQRFRTLYAGVQTFKRPS